MSLFSTYARLQFKQQEDLDEKTLFKKLLEQKPEDFYQFSFISGNQKSKQKLTQLIEDTNWDQVLKEIKNENFRTELNIPEFWVEEESFKIISSDTNILQKLMELVWIENTFQDLDYANKMIFYSEFAKGKPERQKIS